jgi:hypothetical protein
MMINYLEYLITHIHDCKKFLVVKFMKNTY